MPALIRDLRLTFLWTETRFDLLSEPPPPNAPLRDLGRSATYAVRFAEISANGLDRDGLMFPWPARGHRFWQLYLEGVPATRVSAGQAWKHLVPLRRKLTVRLEADWLPGWGTVDGYLYPFGITVAVTVRIATGAGAAIELFDAVDLAQRVRSGGTFTLTERHGDSRSGVALDQIGQEMLGSLRDFAFGPGAAVGAVSATPFSIATVVKATDVDAQAATQDQSEVHRALEALTTWRRTTWRADALPPVANATSDIRRAPPGHLVYARRRGRAIWFPGVSASTDPSLRSLGCYHCNQVFAALQVESLGAFARLAAARLQRGERLTPVEDQCVRYAGGILGRLYAGAATTYRSGGCRAHIQQGDLTAPINTVRNAYQMSPLA